MNGNAASEVDRLSINKDGTVSAIYKNGSQVAAYRIPLGTVTSVDMLRPLPGNVYSVTNDSGNMQVNYAGDAGLGTLSSGALEQSTVDLASELTIMIEAQNSYTANSKVFQTGAELMDVLVNLRR
jgi:flagellar hook protein FlgE